MIESNTTSLERRFKRLVPQVFKTWLIHLLVNRYIGSLVQKFCLRSLPGARFDFSILEPSVAARVYFGIWEPAEIHYAKKYVEDGDNVIELGSSIGVTLATLCSTKQLNSYIAVEASAISGKILSSTIALFGEFKITKLDYAISYSQHKLIDFLELSLTGSRVANKSSLLGKQANSRKVKVIQLNEIVNKYLPGKKPYVLISDIEGAEAEIFARDAMALDNCKRVICELDDTDNHSIADQLLLLTSLGFSMTEFYGNVYVLDKTLGEE